MNEYYIIKRHKLAYGSYGFHFVRNNPVSFPNFNDAETYIKALEKKKSNSFDFKVLFIGGRAKEVI